jgi:hypothetical protein
MPLAYAHCVRVTRAHTFLLVLCTGARCLLTHLSHMCSLSSFSQIPASARGHIHTQTLSLSLARDNIDCAHRRRDTSSPARTSTIVPRSATAIAFAVPCPVPGQRGHAPVNSTRATRSKLRHRPSLSSSLPTSHLRCPLRWSSLHSTSPFRPVSSHVAWLGTIRETRRQTALSSSIVAGALFRTARARATKYSRTRARASALVRPNKLFHR